MLPSDLWGRDEDYLWYSTGGAACFTDLEAGVLGEGTLQARYIRGSFDDKPFTLGKYESTRIRVAIAELAANGGTPMGFYTRFKDPAAREEIVRYYRFLEKHDSVYRGNRPYAEFILAFPRSKVHAGEVEAVEAFKKRGLELLDDHVLFSVAPDDRIRLPKREVPENRSRFDGPKTVRVSASRPAKGNEISLHFVNYNRVEPTEKRSPGRGIADEKPIAVEKVDVDFVVPKGAKVKSVHIATPESPDAVEARFTLDNGRLRFEVPKFLVYSIARIDFE
jgi:hypothetical protein